MASLRAARPRRWPGRCRPSVAVVVGRVLRLLPQEVLELVEQALLVDEAARQFQLALVVPDHRVVEAVQGVPRALAHAALPALGGGTGPPAPGMSSARPAGAREVLTKQAGDEAYA